jgi:hypothetical protein
MALTKITNDVIESGSISHSALADSGVTAGAHGSGTQVPVITVNSKGLITDITPVSVAGVSNVTYNSTSGILTVSTTDGSNFNVDLNTGTEDSLSLTSLTVANTITGQVSSIANHDTDDLAEGAANQYFTTSRARASISATGSLSYNSTTGVMSFTQGNTDTIAEGSTNLYYTTARARAAISATGSLSYNSTTGVMSFTQGNTDTVAEGSTNLYYTDARVRSVLSTDNIANENYVDTAINNLINSAPGTLDTLDELAAALGDDANFASTVTNSLATKVDKINITGATVGSGTDIPVITYNSQGQITSATTASIPPITKATIDALNVDADTLDGVHASNLLRSDVDDAFSATLTVSGVVRSTNNANVDGPNFNVSTTNKTVNEYAYRVDRSGAVVGGITIDGRGILAPQSTMGGSRILTAADEGSGNGLDADLLDGLQASQFLRSDADDQTTNVLAIGSASGAINGEKLRVTDTGTFIASFQRTDGTPHLLFKGTGGTSGYTGRFYMDNGAFQLSQGDATGSQSGNIWLHGLSNGNVGIGTPNPGGLLHLKKSSGAPILRLEAPASELARIELGDGSNYAHISSRPDMSDGLMFYENGAANTVMRGGNVGIGDTSPSYKLDVNGTIRATNDVIADSDIRLKSEIKPITNAVDTVKALSGKSYIKDDKPSIGLIAQEVEEVMPFMVHTASDEMGTKSVNYQNMVALLIEAVKEQQEQIDELKRLLEAK